MRRNPRLENKIRIDIQLWLDSKGTDFIICIKEFCQGNRAALSQVLEFVDELGRNVFVGDGNTLDKELLEKLEYGIFDLIGKFNSTPGGEALEEAIEKNIVEYLTAIFTEAKKEWNLNQYKITASYEELDPNNSTIPADQKPVDQIDSSEQVPERKYTRKDARLFLDELVAFAKTRLRGEKNKVIAVKWLENPDRQKDYSWLATLTDSSTGSIKVTLTRLKQTLNKNYSLRYVNDKLVMSKVDMVAKSHPT